jgi:hypothetical protein
MVEGKVHSRERLSAILTLVVVAQEDVLPRQHLDAMRHLAKGFQPDHGREHDAGVNLSPSMLLNVSRILHNKNKSAARSTNVKRLV